MIAGRESEYEAEPADSRTSQLIAENDALRSELDRFKRRELDFIMKIEEEINEFQSDFNTRDKLRDEEIIRITRENTALSIKYEMATTAEFRELQQKYERQTDELERIKVENETLISHIDNWNSRDETFIDELEKEIRSLRDSLATGTITLKNTTSESSLSIAQLNDALNSEKEANSLLRRQLDESDQELQLQLENEIQELTDLQQKLMHKESELKELRGTNSNDE